MRLKPIYCLLLLFLRSCVSDTYPYVTQLFTYGIVQHQSQYQLSYLKPNYEIDILSTSTSFKGFPISEPSTPIIQALFSRVSAIETFVRVFLSKILTLQQNPQTRTVFQIGVQRGYPYLVENDINGNIINLRKFDSYVFYNLEYDMNQQRLLALYFDTQSDQLIFSSFPTNTTGFLLEEKLIENISFNVSDSINIGSSTFDQTNSTFYFTITHNSGLENNVSSILLVTLSVTAKSVKNIITLPPTIVDITAIAHSQGSQILAVTSQLNVDHFDYYLLSIDSSTGTTSSLLDFQLEANPLQLEFPGRSSKNLYQPELVYFILQSQVGPLFMEHNITDHVTRKFIYPKDAYLAEIFMVTNCSLGQAEVNSQCVDCEVGQYANRFLLDSCDSCEAGTFGNETKLQSCTPCARGYFTVTRYK
jgi:hypothetical protein